MTLTMPLQSQLIIDNSDHSLYSIVLLFYLPLRKLYMYEDDMAELEEFLFELWEQDRAKAEKE